MDDNEFSSLGEIFSPFLRLDIDACDSWRLRLTGNFKAPQVPDGISASPIIIPSTAPVNAVKPPETGLSCALESMKSQKSSKIALTRVEDEKALNMILVLLMRQTADREETRVHRSRSGLLCW